MNEDASSVYTDLLVDTRNKTPEEEIFNNLELERLDQLLDVIDAREAAILRMRYGLETGKPMTLKVIGEELGLTRERVRQIEVDALKKLQAQLKDDRPSRFFRQSNSEEDNGRQRRAKAG